MARTIKVIIVNPQISDPEGIVRWSISGNNDQITPRTYEVKIAEIFEVELTHGVAFEFNLPNFNAKFVAHYDYADNSWKMDNNGSPFVSTIQNGTLKVAYLLKYSGLG